ncbi:uncharacterized protein LOC131598229 [Vicia villosa]|uniref:uncharacterized protein LOC131598229 n=1 Tax=Vicia villosa TaxID=3911 RepID=UPI00273C7F12|nr:uncharacterized protein LOC131598229 [Vicia villosa]
MEQLHEDLTQMRTKMGINLNHCMEAIQALAFRHEELRQVLQRPDVNVNLNTREGLVNQNVRNTVEIPIPVKESSHHENNSEFEAFRFPINEFDKRFHLLDERLKAMEGRDSIDLDAAGLCLVPGIKIPAKFKVPNFEKYRGTTCLIAHVKDSLSGTSLEWYNQLERTNVRAWKELSEAFVKRYKHNSNMAPTRMQLHALTQKTDESFREYARRWRELAAKVQPPLLEKELMDMFKDVMESPYYQCLAACKASDFAELVLVGERMEHGIKNGNVQVVDTPSEFHKHMNEKTSVVSDYEEESPDYPPDHISCHEAVAVTPVQDDPQICVATHTQPPTQFVQRKSVPCDQSVQYVPQKQNYQQNRHPHGRQRHRRPKRVYDPIPMTRDKLFSHLINLSLVEPKQPKPVRFPYHVGFDPNVSCDYHAGAPGHSIEDCQPFKDKVQDLIDSKAITFTPEGQN